MEAEKHASAQNPQQVATVSPVTDSFFTHEKKKAF
jgi:hypothetical protein